MAEHSQNTYQSKLEIERPKPHAKALELLSQNRLDDALNIIDDAIEEDGNDFNNWNVKGLILDGKKEFFESVECFNKALKLNNCDEIHFNKAMALYRWAKVSYFPECNFTKAMSLIDTALDTIPNTGDSSELWFLKGEIYQSLEDNVQARKCFLKAENRLDELKALEDEIGLFEIHKNDTLINITGTNFYKGLEPFEPKTIVTLVRDTENEHDPDAIAAMIDGEIVGYVANSDYTLIYDVKSASEIKNMVRQSATAEVIFIFQNEFVIARLL